MQIGVPQETVEGERRVALVPEVVRKLTGKGLEVLVQKGAGSGALIPDAEYEEAGGRTWPSMRGHIAERLSAFPVNEKKRPALPLPGLDWAAVSTLNSLVTNPCSSRVARWNDTSLRSMPNRFATSST